MWEGVLSFTLKALGTELGYYSLGPPDLPIHLMHQEQHIRVAYSCGYKNPALPAPAEYCPPALLSVPEGRVCHRHAPAWRGCAGKQLHSCCGGHCSADELPGGGGCPGARCEITKAGLRYRGWRALARLMALTPSQD